MQKKINGLSIISIILLVNYQTAFHDTSIMIKFSYFLVQVVYVAGLGMGNLAIYYAMILQPNTGAMLEQLADVGVQTYPQSDQPWKTNSSPTWY